MEKLKVINGFSDNPNIRLLHKDVCIRLYEDSSGILHITDCGNRNVVIKDPQFGSLIDVITSYFDWTRFTEVSPYLTFDISDLTTKLIAEYVPYPDGELSIYFKNMSVVSRNYFGFQF